MAMGVEGIVCSGGTAVVVSRINYLLDLMPNLPLPALLVRQKMTVTFSFPTPKWWNAKAEFSYNPEERESSGFGHHSQSFYVHMHICICNIFVEMDNYCVAAAQAEQDNYPIKPTCRFTGN